MNPEDALLIKAVMKELTGTIGMTHAQLARACHVSQRRMTHHLFSMEKAGLIAHDAKGNALLADDLIATTWRHADGLNDAGAPVSNESHIDTLRSAVRIKSAADSQYINDVFMHLYGVGPYPFDRKNK